jgi:hypothetical protein
MHPSRAVEKFRHGRGHGFRSAAMHTRNPKLVVPNEGPPWCREAGRQGLVGQFTQVLRKPGFVEQSVYIL